MTITSDLEIILSHRRRRQLAADAVPPIKGLLFHPDAPEAAHDPDPVASPLPLEQLLQDSAEPTDVVYGFKIRF